jgi:hypothetical protein
MKYVHAQLNEDNLEDNVYHEKNNNVLCLIYKISNNVILINLILYFYTYKSSALSNRNSFIIAVFKNYCINKLG